MTDRIKILPEALANKIAAGEVIQRPASAVKELLENAIDANASTLTVVVKESGRQLLQVIDDGDGMSREDAVLAFERHATSKIEVYEDLLSVRTLGFRGEALASMAAVAQVEMKTRRETDETGTLVRIEGGIVKEVSPAAAPKGTSVALKNLFYNTPARRKFLKTPSTEFKHIFDVVQRVAIAYPDRSVSMRSDDEVVLQLHASQASKRISDVFGEKLASGVFSFEASAGPIGLTGFLCRPDFARKSRVEQYLFLNRRPIVSKSLQHAVFQAYENLLEKGSFPFFVLHLSMDPRAVDVNVHPAKSEVKFEDESALYRFVLSSIRSALSAENLVPSFGIRAGVGNVAEPGGLRLQTTGGSGGPRTKDWEAFFGTTREHAPTSSASATGLFAAQLKERGEESAPGSPGREVSPAGGVTRAPLYAQIWQIHNKYIILSTENGLLVIDQHGAHERVLYERAVSNFSETHNKSQQLLFPHTLECSAGDAALIEQLIPALDSIGFSVRIFGKSAVIIDGVPLDVKPGEEGRILPQILDLFKEDDQSLHLESREKLAKSYSCKAAIKAGDPLNEIEMRALIAQLFESEIPFVCPHGRPVMITLSLSELDKRFGRTS